MDVRNRIVTALCLAALAGAAGDPAWAGDPPSGPDPADGTPVSASAEKKPAKDAEEFVVVDEMPQVLTRVAPRYPASARKRGQEGTVFLSAYVDTNGRMTRVKIARGKGLAPDLDQAAVEAVRQWTFRPAMAKGRPVAVFITVPVKFALH